MEDFAFEVLLHAVRPHVLELDPINEVPLPGCETADARESGGPRSAARCFKYLIQIENTFD